MGQTAEPPIGAPRTSVRQLPTPGGRMPGREPHDACGIPAGEIVMTTSNRLLSMLCFLVLATGCAAGQVRAQGLFRAGRPPLAACGFGRTR